VAALDRVGRGLHVQRMDDAVAGVGVEEEAPCSSTWAERKRAAPPTWLAIEAARLPLP
jgi:hypothetical protein